MTTAVAAQLDTFLHEVDTALHDAHVPGLELAVVRDGDVVFSGGVGIRGVDDRLPVGSATLFHHGSCGKAYTGLLAAILAAEGVLDLDAPVRRHVPELRLPDAVVAERVTVRDLLSHRSGLGRHDLAWIFNPSWSTEELVRRLEHLPLAGEFRAQFGYSNFGFALAGLAMTRAAGERWSDLVHGRLLDPLGMSRTLVSVAPMATDLDAAKPHIVRDGVPRRTLYRVLEGIAPAGEVISCADDSVRWLLTQLGDGGIAADVVGVAQSPQMLLPQMSPFEEMELVATGFGWITGRYRGRKLVWHNGGVDGFATQTLLLPDDRIGLVASANVFPTELPLAVVLQLADHLLGVSSAQSWFDRLPPAATPPAVDVPDQVSAAPAPPAHALADYAGHYEHPGYGALDVAASTGLSVRMGEAELEARHRHFDTWDLHYDPLGADGTLTFLTGPDGAVAEARLSLEPGELLAFVRQDPASSTSK